MMCLEFLASFHPLRHAVGPSNIFPMQQHLNSFRKRTVSVLATLVLSASAAWAVNPFPVRDIRVEGLQRVEAGTVFASLPLKVGDTYTDEKGAAAIRTWCTRISAC